MLIDLLDAEFEESCNAAVRALETFDDAAIKYIDQHFDRLPEFVRILALGFAVRSGSPAAVSLIDRHWDEFRDVSDYELGEAVLVLDEPLLNERLKGLVGQNLPDIDRAFAILGCCMVVWQRSTEKSRIWSDHSSKRTTADSMPSWWKPSMVMSVYPGLTSR